jgi:hypothetical protein
VIVSPAEVDQAEPDVVFLVREAPVFSEVVPAIGPVFALILAERLL